MPNRTCSVDGCDRNAHARGWCTMHYQRWKRLGDPTRNLIEERPKTCMVDGCERPVHGNGMCGAHWVRNARHGSPTGGDPDRLPPGLKCSEPACDLPAKARQLCRAHYKAWRLRNVEGERSRRAEQYRSWRERNADYIAEYSRQWRARAPEQRAAWLAEWKSTNPWHASLYTYSKRRRAHGLPVLIEDLVEPAALFARDGGGQTRSRRPSITSCR